MMRYFACLCALTVLAACGQPGGKPEDAAALPPGPAPVPDAAVNTTAPGAFSGDFNAVGTEPFWAVEVRPLTLKLSRPDAIDLTVANAGPKVEGETAVWTAPGLVLTLSTGQCSDGMSDRSYPYVAQATVGETVLKGCAMQP